MVLNISIWVFAYLLGSISFGVLLARSQNIDLRQRGSRNIGATNVARILGTRSGVLTLIGDVFKGWFSVALASSVLNDPVAIAGAGLMVFLGHLFSIFLKFKGGKGVAVGLGIHLYIMPVATMAAIAVFAFALRISKYVSIGSMFAAMTLPMLGMFMKIPFLYVCMSLSIAILIVLKHHENIRRIIAGTESHFPKK